MKRFLARVTAVSIAVLASIPAATATSTEGLLHATPLPPETEPAGVGACAPAIGALAMLERMARAMGKDADVLADAEEALRSQAADCLDHGDDVTEISTKDERDNGAKRLAGAQTPQRWPATPYRHVEVRPIAEWAAV